MGKSHVSEIFNPAKNLKRRMDEAEAASMGMDAPASATPAKAQKTMTQFEFGGVDKMTPEEKARRAKGAIDLLRKK